MIRHVRLLATGGTIATTTDPATGRSAPTLGPDVAALAAVDGVEVTVEVLAGEPSWALSPADMVAIAGRAAAVAREPGVDGVVVTHGTTTLEYTAFLADLLVDGDVPVVLTGAMRRADDPDPDGPANLRDSIAVAASAEARGSGAMVVFAGRIIAGRHVWKADRSRVDAFVDLSGARRTCADLSAGLSLGRRKSRIGFRPAIEPNVGFVKVVPGSSGAMIDAALAAGPTGLVIEALPGSGGITPWALPALSAAAARIPVVIASRAPFGTQARVPTGGTGEPLVGIPLLSAGRLSAEAAWLLLMVVLGQGPQDPAAIRAAFDRVAHDDPAGAP